MQGISPIGGYIDGWLTDEEAYGGPLAAHDSGTTRDCTTQTTPRQQLGTGSTRGDFLAPPDVMSQATGDKRSPTARWINADTWRSLLDDFGQPPSLAPVGARALTEGEPATRTLAGRLDGDVLELAPSYRLDHRPERPLGASGDLTVEYLDAAGATLASTGVELAAGVAGAGADVQPFAGFLGPVARRPRTFAVRIMRGDRMLAERRASANAPLVELESPNGGETYGAGEDVSVRWTAFGTPTATPCTRSSSSQTTAGPPGRCSTPTSVAARSDSARRTT